MRYTVQLVLVAVCAVLVAAWTKEDHEIFRLRDEITAYEGPDVTFYDLLGVKSDANQEDIVKAYRQKSKLLHPDKVKRALIAKRSKASKGKGKGKKTGAHPSQRELAAALKEAHERTSHINIVATILRGPMRERYDHFLKNGFPKWKGTGYYYSRFRPGLGSVLLGLFIMIGGAAHYVALILSWKRQREFIDRYIRHARKAAWGDELGIQGIPGLDSTSLTGPTPLPDADDQGAAAMNRRQKRMMDREGRKKGSKGPAKISNSGTSTPSNETTGVAGPRRRVIAENGKVLIVDRVGNVFLEEETEDGGHEEFLLDIDEIHRPTIRDTVLFRLPSWFHRKTVGRILQRSGSDAVVDPAKESPESMTDSFEILEAPSEDATISNGKSARKRSKRTQK
jgi:hypothetical protein